MHITLSEGQTTMCDGDNWILHDLTLSKGRYLLVEAGGVSNQKGNAPEGLNIEVHKKMNRGTNQKLKINEPHKEYPSSKKLNVGGCRVVVQLRNKSGNTQDVSGYLSFRVSK